MCRLLDRQDVEDEEDGSDQVSRQQAHGHVGIRHNDCLPDVDDATLVQMFGDMPNDRKETTAHGGNRISEHADVDEHESRVSVHADDAEQEMDDRTSEHADDINEDVDDRSSGHADDADEIELEESSSDEYHPSNDHTKTKAKKRKVNGHRSDHSSSSGNTSSNPDIIATRRSTRVTAKPLLYDPSQYHVRDLTNFMSHQSSSSIRPPRHYRMDPNEFALLVLDEPITYEQAVNSSERREWLNAIQDELDAHDKNHTFSIVEQTSDMNIIGCRWVFKRKRDVNGRVIKFKARLVAKGYNQVKGIDFHDTFAPVLNARSLRILFAYSVIYNTQLDQLDVKTAFLNAPVQEDIFVDVPEGMNIDDGYVLKLNQALYGIKQAPREWFKEISSTLHSFGYSSCIKDTCLYVKKTKTNNIILLGLFVDDMPVAYHSCKVVEWCEDKQKLKNKYELSELGDVQHILGMKVTRSSSSLTISQETYITDKLELFNMHESRSEKTPAIDVRKLERQISSNANHTDVVVDEVRKKKNQLKNEDLSRQLNEEEVKTYQMMVGSLIYASISTRPDITHSVNLVARHMSSPTVHNSLMVKRVFRYLNGTRSLGLRYTNTNKTSREIAVSAYCDADWGGDLTSRRSTTGYCTFINDNLISWQTKRQPTVALSSAEAEYMAICDVAKEIMWVRMILAELHLDVVTPTIIYVDNKSAITMSENNSDHERTKHIDIKHHFIRDLVNDGSIALKWISTNEQLADVFTKTLTAPTYTLLRDKLMSDSNEHQQ
jgi:hypothetical protein